MRDIAAAMASPTALSGATCSTGRPSASAADVGIPAKLNACSEGSRTAFRDSLVAAGLAVTGIGSIAQRFARAVVQHQEVGLILAQVD